MKRTGELLRKTREEKGLSVHEVGLFLKINPRILQAIEEGDQAQLPAKTFLRGFVQSYAKFLKLDSNEVLQIFTQEMAPTVKQDESQEAVVKPAVVAEPVKSIADEDEVELKAEEEKEHKEPAPKKDAFQNSVLTKASSQNDTLRVRTFAISVIGLILVFVIYFANSVVKKYQKEAEIAPEVAATLETSSSDTAKPADASTDRTTPAADSTATSSTTAPAASSTPTAVTTPAGTAATTSKPGITTQTAAPAPVATTKPATPAAPTAVVNTPATTPAATTPAPATALKPGTTPSTPAVKPAAPPATTAPTPAAKPTTTPAATTPAAGVTPATTPAAAVKPIEGKLTEVIVEASQNVEIEYSSSKSSPQRLALKADQIHTFKSRSGVRLKISNGGAVNIIVNGKDLGAPGAAGQSVQVSYE